MKKVLVGLILAALSLLPIGMVFAQGVLISGQVVSGEISAANSRGVVQFSGRGG